MADAHRGREDDAAEGEQGCLALEEQGSGYLFLFLARALFIPG